VLENFGWKKTADSFSGTSMATRCYEHHPALKLGKGTLYGGAARTPKVKDADIYVVLQSGDMNGWQSDPWEKQVRTEVYYGIRDMNAPENVPRFKKLVTWVCTQLQQGKKVHVGCIGGHGRTGTVISAIVAEMTGEKDAIQYVRKHYCKKAVESKAQVAFLMKHYGVSEVEPAKTYKPAEPRSTGYGDGPWTERLAGFTPQKQKALPYPGSEPKVRRIDPEGLTKATKSFGPMASARSLWKAKKRKS
jgi:hypothetical protein